jgi:hypothetical protein
VTEPLLKRSGTAAGLFVVLVESLILTVVAQNSATLFLDPAVGARSGADVGQVRDVA